MKLLERLFRRGAASADGSPGSGFFVYVSPDCDCCRSALSLLASHGVRPTVVNLEDAPSVRAQHGGATPLVMLDGRLRFVGKVDPVLLKRLIDHRRRKAAAG